MRHEGGCWPTSEQELLLRASLLRRQESIAAWREWHRRVNVETLDPGSQRLLPLLFRNLEAQGMEHSVLKRYASVYRLNWYRNQIVFRDVKRVLSRFYDEEIGTTILGGAPLVLLHYEDYGVRAVDDLAVLVEPDQVGPALGLLEELGWKTDFVASRKRIALTQTAWVENDEGVAFTLNWYGGDAYCRSGADRERSSDTTPLDFLGVPARTLNATSRLVDTLAQGIVWARTPPLRWVADCVAILGGSQSDVDWDELPGQVGRCDVILPVMNGLAYLREHLAPSIPVSVFERLQELPVSRRAKAEHQVRTLKANPLRRLRFHWFAYRRLRAGTGSERYLSGFLGYLQGYVRVQNLWRLLWLLLKWVLGGTYDSYRA